MSGQKEVKKLADILPNLKSCNLKELTDLEDLITLYRQKFSKRTALDLFYLAESHTSYALYTEDLRGEIYLTEEQMICSVSNLFTITRCYPYPETIDDFIYCCLRSGIKLIWRKQGESDE